MIYNFIWNDNREKGKRETMNKNYLEKGEAENDRYRQIYRNCTNKLG